MFCWERKSDLFTAVGTEARCVQVCVEIEKWTGAHLQTCSVYHTALPIDVFMRCHAMIGPDIFRINSVSLVAKGW